MPRPRSICGPEQFEHAAGAGAEIEQRTERPVGERRDDRLLDRLVGDVQLADAVPFGGVAARNRSAPRRRARRAPTASRSRSRAMVGVGGIEPRDQLARQRGAAAALAQPEERPGALAEALDQPGLGQQLADAARCAAATGAGCR